MKVIEEMVKEEMVKIVGVVSSYDEAKEIEEIAKILVVEKRIMNIAKGIEVSQTIDSDNSKDKFWRSDNEDKHKQFNFCPPCIRGLF